MSAMIHLRALNYTHTDTDNSLFANENTTMTNNNVASNVVSRYTLQLVVDVTVALNIVEPVTY